MFSLTTEQFIQLEKWKTDHNKTCEYASGAKQGAIGGRLTYCFTPVTLGVITKVKCACNAEIDLTAYEEW